MISFRDAFLPAMPNNEGGTVSVYVLCFFTILALVFLFQKSKGRINILQKASARHGLFVKYGDASIK